MTIEKILPTPHMQRKHQEQDEQIRLVAWMQKKGILHHSIPNGGKRTIQYAVMMKKTGLVRGIPDLFIPYLRGGYGGLYIEMKRITGGSILEEQQFWIEQLRKQGYVTAVCKGFEAAKKEVEEYLALDTMTASPSC